MSVSAVLARMRSRLAQEGGFTLIELLVAASIGIVIILVAFGMLDSSVRAFGSSEKRIDVSQRGRLAMDNVTALLRSQTCGFNSTAGKWEPALLSGTKDKVVFWSDIGEDGTDRDANGRTSDGRRVRGVEFAANKVNRLEYPGTGQTASATPIPQQLLNNVAANNGTGLFRYYAYNPAAANQSLNPAPALYVELPAPLSAADVRRVVRITSAFTTYPEKSSATDKLAADFKGDFLSRTASSPYEYDAPPEPTVLEPRCE